ncbi:MAG: hypothetical protein DI582_08930 [Azospirillum brasilense]|nr:MAG: hypothetical protein DI582_08930 [Azospirillum brasilense]
MRPDLDEYEELNSETAAPRGKAMSWLVLSVAVVGFGALAYYAYQSGSKTVGDGQMLVVEAEEGPIKEAPVEAGGEEFPHKDKTIYDALSPYRTDEQKVETLLPTPEEPVIPEPAVGEAKTEEKAAQATTFVNKGVEEKEAAEEAAEGERSSPPPVAAPVEPEVKKAEPVAAPVKAPVVVAAPVAAPAPLEKVEVKDATVKTQATPVAKVEPKPTPAPAKVEPKPVAAPAATGGDYKVQLAALKSESDARQTWSKITAKHGDVVKGSPIIVKADVKGVTYYRLRASGFASADAAKRACATLSSRGQACMSVGK